MYESLLDDQFIFVCQNLQLLIPQSSFGDLALNTYHSVVDTRGISKSVMLCGLSLDVHSMSVDNQTGKLCRQIVIRMPCLHVIIS